MKTIIFAAAVLIAAPTFATDFENFKVDSSAIEGSQYLAADAELPGHIKFEEPIFEKPKFGPFSVGVGKDLGGFVLADRLDSHSDMFTRKLGSKVWDLSVAGDSKFEISYLRLTREDETQLHKIKNVKELRGKGINIQIDDNTSYNIKVSVNIFSPTRGSKLKITAINGTKGPSHKIKTGAILDRIEEKSFIFKTAGKEYWTLYGTDVDPETNWFTDTKSFLVIQENGLSTKAYPIPESKLPVGEAVSVALGDAKVVIRRNPDGTIRFFEPGNGIGRIAKL